MMDEKSFNKIASMVLLAVLAILTFFILRPILISTIFALILSFIFYPIYKKFLLWTKNKNLSALIICLILLAIIIIPLLFFVPLLVKQTFEVYLYMQGEDVLVPLHNLISNFFPSSDISNDLIIAVNSFTSKLASSFLSKFTEILLNSPIILLNLVLILFVFFFGLRDGDKFVNYIQTVSPLSKEAEKKIFKQFKDITHSVIFGQIVVGIAQGIITAIALFIFKVPNALVLTLIATFVGVLPIIGPWLVWVPVDIYLFLTGRTAAGFGMLVYGLLIITWVDTLVRPLIVSKKTKMNSAIVLVSMLGGLFVFGVLGLILGPLIISYLILLLESYKNKRESILIQKEK
jgi:predicted PurR-regulated permease PerM